MTATGTARRNWHSWSVEAKLQMLARLRSMAAPMESLDFLTWLKLTSPDYQWDVPHLAYIRGALEQLTTGEIKRLALFLPPRHGKSAMTTVRYAAWRLEQDPRLRIIIGCYSYGLTEVFSRQIRRIVRERGLPLNRERQRAGEWETEAGGGIAAVGVGTGVTGRGAQLLIIDDPVKNREEANSASYRDRVWDWYSNDLYTRLEPDGQIVLIQTRWHTDDLAGRILDSERVGSWKVINLPAEAEEHDALGRLPGEPLWPERFDLAALADIKATLGSWAYEALYQQRPLPAGGAIFQRDWFPIVETAPVQGRAVRYWDKGGGYGGDYTTGVRILRSPDGLFYVTDVVRGQWSALGRNQVIRQTAELDGHGTVIWVEQEGGSSGKESAQISIRELAGYPVYPDSPSGGKEVRALPFAAQCEAGNVRLVKGAWNAAYVDELTLFPSGKYDDQVDASSGAFNKLMTMLRQPAQVMVQAKARGW